MNEKLKNVAIKIYPNVRDTVDTPQEMYGYLNKLFGKQKTYFTNFFSPDDLLKIILLTYSIKTFGSFEWADSIMDKLFFIQVFNTEKEPSVTTCDQCDGGGNETCENCDGHGQVSCGDCDGKGEQTCYECDGSGEVEDFEGGKVECDNCGGRGSEECSTCDGTGYIYCDDCSGDGSITCSECNGRGEIESDTSFDCTFYEICSWDSDLNMKALAVEQTFEPLADSEIIDYEKNRNFIVINRFTQGVELSEDVEENELYCLYVSETPKLKNNVQPFQQKLHLVGNLTNNYLS